jgi:beta-glucuronidase
MVECGSTYRPRGDTKLFLLIGAVKCRPSFWGNGRRVGQHEDGFTSSNSDITAVAHAADNFVVAAVDYRRREDGVPNLETDSWNCRGQMKALPLLRFRIVSPDTFIHQCDLHLEHGQAVRRARREHRIPGIY